ncbi:DUF2970 domain-containing protein [Candidatus Skiveiella danica]|jgi:hypothetical protein|uniref:DUF2970 domain-containing protein n=1 Tax=Candidatus Skiveiella danica TaxID=3386177 RepID=UPI0009D61B0C|nr:MAG: hypothetical protein BWX79_00164 [Alphaproteobacteria bacterium ADurb.Bin100]HPL78477.1 DUF2970 domain-containing protein [Burkholderiaceae bacterium]
MNQPAQRSAPSSGSLLRTVRAVAWSFLGIRKKSGLQEDMERVSPFHLIVTGIGAAVIFVLGLVALVNWVVAP